MSKKNLFSQTFLNILQFGGNLSAPNLNWHVQWILAHLLTPLGPLGARQQWRYKSFKICFDYFVTVAPPSRLFTLMKMLPNVSFIMKALKKVFLSVLIATISQFPVRFAHYRHDCEPISPVCLCVLLQSKNLETLQL